MLYPLPDGVDFKLKVGMVRYVLGLSPDVPSAVATGKFFVNCMPVSDHSFNTTDLEIWY